MKKILLTLLAVVLVAAAAVGVFALQVRSYATAPTGVAVGTFEVKRGARLSSVLERLREAGVVARPKWVYWYARATKVPPLRSGTYEVKAEQSPLQILQMIAEGRVKTESFTIAEGLNRWQVRALLVQNKWLTAQEFDRLCEDKELLAKHDIPGPACDGYLFPETYTFARGVSAETLFATFFKTFKSTFAEVTKEGRGPLGLSPRELTTLASIVEKETGAPEERPQIACVFYNRLKAKPQWRLETDPTVIYAATLMDPAFDGNIKRSHLREMKNPYNTYHVYGLPPGPIASPGRAALEAVAEPATCDDFFFVSMNNGRHVFCPTYECHLQNVSKWQVQYFKRK